MGKRLELQGQKFGDLTVVGVSHVKKGPQRGQVIPTNRKVMWLCKCECGNETVVSGVDLKRGHTRSCGHLLPKRVAAIRRVVANYRNGARARNLSFELTVDECDELFQSDCHYCGCLPSNTSSVRGTQFPITYNGIDRVDNSKGYTRDNVVPCCRTCNIMKSALDEGSFMEHISKIFHFKREVDHENM